MKKITAILLAALMLCATAIYAAPAGMAALDDPTAAYVPETAPYEDSALQLWFDYSSKKINSSVTESSGMNTFAAYLAKNEIEDIQFVLAAAQPREGMRAEITPFANGQGDTLQTELMIQYYHDCGSYGMVPDAIPPLAAYGDFSLTPGTSQAFLIRIHAAEDAVSGWYTATLNILDCDGRTVKTAQVFAYVWDFALSEATRCATSINLDMNALRRTNPNTTLSDEALYRTYYDYLLENRVCAYFVPVNLYRCSAADAQKYLDNPRVTSYQLGYFTSGRYDAVNDQLLMKRALTNTLGGAGTDRFNKAYYFTEIVDAVKPAQLEALRAAYDTLKNSFGENTPWMINTFIADIDYTTADGSVIDQIAYYSDFVDHWCSKPFAYTTADELSVPGSKLMQPQKWDSVYGAFAERMAEKRAAGQKVWWFLSWDVEAPYINYYMQTDGTAQRILFWQQYDHDVQGFLYNFANFWLGDTVDPYTNNITNSAYPDAHGESILIYPGSRYGLEGPVGSLRLEAMRDGIEDYQLLSMLEELQGDGAADALIDRLTTGMVHYSTDAAAYYAVRKDLGSAVEAALKMESCIHEYTATVVAATCTEDGVEVYTCENCGHSYTGNTIPATGHSYKNGACESCGEADPDAGKVVPGDIDGDHRVTDQDVLLLRLHLLGRLTEENALTEAQLATADVDGNGRISTADAMKIRLLALGRIAE